MFLVFFTKNKNKKKFRFFFWRERTNKKFFIFFSFFPPLLCWGKTPIYRKTKMPKICIRAALSKFWESHATENWTMYPPKNIKNFIIKIKILKRRLVLIRHQFLQNTQIEVHLSEIRNLIETNVTWKSLSRRKQHLSPVRNLFIWCNLVVI